MRTPPAIHIPVENRLLAALPPEEYAQFFPILKPVHLARGTVLYEADDIVVRAYFLTSGVVSLLSTTEDGATIEVGIVGNEGMVGIPVILGFDTTPYRVMVQTATNALEIRADTLRREFNRGGRLHDLLLRYTHALLCQIAQSAVCNRFHTVEKRLCRWLLISGDRAHSDRFFLTQEFISHMLGVPRTHVTMTARTLWQKNLISYKRGEITIVDRRGLETAACECYRVVLEEVGSFLDG